jgi:MFS family permease
MRLSCLFGTLYFIQGIGEPTEGLIAQPVRSLLDTWKLSPSQIGVFAMLLSLPWAIKPVFGLLTDFVPLWRRRRKSYLILVNTAALVGLAGLWLAPPEHGSVVRLFAWLLVPTMSVACADVVIDALMVETGQPLGKTGLFQSIQWAAMYAATIIAGVWGGALSGSGRQDLGFLICAVAMVPALALSVWAVREPPRPARSGSARAAVRQLWQAARTPGVLAVGAFLFLWNFNPFCSNVLQLHMKHGLQWDEQFYGITVSLQAVASIVASVSYGFYCRRISRQRLVHLSIVLGIVSTIGYWVMFDQASAVLVSLAVGFTYMTANLIQLDLAARVCPPETAGTVFALLMSLSNLGLSLSMGLGGHLYELGIAWWDSRTLAFNLLVAIGAGVTACCWLLVPLLRRAHSGSGAGD